MEGVVEGILVLLGFLLVLVLPHVGVVLLLLLLLVVDQQELGLLLVLDLEV